ncbi:MAG: hypothetical protein WCO91_11380 [Gemmataceae bacterium]
MTIATLAMESIDEPRLESDTDYRVGYLAKFMGFGPDDVQAIHDSAAHLAPLVPRWSMPFTSNFSPSTPPSATF